MRYKFFLTKFGFIRSLLKINNMHKAKNICLLLIFKKNEMAQGRVTSPTTNMLSQ